MTPKTIEAMKEARRGGLKKHASTKAMLKSMSEPDHERACQKIGDHIAVLEKLLASGPSKAKAGEIARLLRPMSYRLDHVVKEFRSIAEADEREAFRKQWEETERRNAKISEMQSDERHAKKMAIAAQGEKVAQEKEELLQKYRKFYLMTIRGRAIGEIWSNEFEQYRRNGAFEASLFDQLAKHAQPSEPMKVKDMVKGAELAKMIAEAEKQAGGKYTGQKS